MKKWLPPGAGSGIPAADTMSDVPPNTAPAGHPPPSDPFALARDVWAAEAAAVAALGSQVDPDAFRRCVATLAACRGRILTAGCGTSAAAARKIAHSLCCVGRPAAFLSPGDAVHGGLGLVQPGDVVIALSKGGGTREIVNLLPAVRSRHAFLIGVTENANSVLGRAADLWLGVKVEREPDAFNMLATASTLAVVAVFDAVCIALMRATGFTRTEFAVIHPGGAVGQRLGRGDAPAAASETPSVP